jgi:hypothetical protein
VNTRIALVTTKKNQFVVSDYYGKMCAYADELAASGAPHHDDELVVYLLASLDYDYNPVFITIITQVDPITLSKPCSQLLGISSVSKLRQGWPYGQDLLVPLR